LRILYLHQYFNTPQMSGGTRSYEMAIRMIKKGHEVHMITSIRDNSVTFREWNKEIVDGISIYWLSVPYDNKMSFYRRIKSFIVFALNAGKKAISIGGDIIFATSTPLTIAIPAIQAKKKLKIPMLFEVRDLWPELPIAIGAIKSPILIYLAKKLELWAYSNSNEIVALSPGMSEGVAKTGYPIENIHTIPNSSDISLFQLNKKLNIGLQNKYKWNDEDKIIIYTGTLGEINGVEYLVDIANEFTEINNKVKLLIVGDGIEEQAIRNKAKIYNCLDNNLFMINQLPKNKMPGLFNISTIATSLFIPIKEMEANSANKFFDTLAAGKPIVINYGGWQKDLIEKHNIGLVLPREPKIAAKALNELLKNDELLSIMGKNALELAKSKFSRDKLAMKLINVLETLVL
jgi:glycosyltransferase involved in cell wall biosynthesis